MLLLGSFTESPITALIHANAVKYVILSATIVLTYDTMLCLPEEVRLVWMPLLRKRASGWDHMPMKILYLLARYMMIAVCIVALMMCMPVARLSDTWVRDTFSFKPSSNSSAVSTCGSQDKKSLKENPPRCHNATVLTGAADIILESIASGVVFYRLYKLWELGRQGRLALSAIFIVGTATVWAFTFVNMAHIDPTVHYLDFGVYRGCATFSAPRLALGVWIPDAILDTSLVIFFILNALSRPRLKSQNLLRIIYKDGIQFFLTMISMRTINVVFTAFAPPSLFFLGTIFSGAMVTTVSSRVFLGLFNEAQRSTAFKRRAYNEDKIPLAFSRTRSQYIQTTSEAPHAIE